MKPEVSIITPVYNAARFLRETVASVQAQSFQNWEMILVDDGSKDKSFELMQELASEDERIRVFKQENSGPAVARNTGLVAAAGRYICFLDADDIWLQNKLEVQLTLMKENGWVLSFSAYRRFKENVRNSGCLIQVPKEVTYKSLLSHNVIATLTTMIDREQSGPFLMKNEGYDDFILWLEILNRGFKGHGIQQDLARYRIVPGSVSSKKFSAAKWVWHIYRNVERLSLPISLFIFLQYALKVSKKHARF